MARAGGFQCGYEIRKTADKGLGVFTTGPVAPGAIVWRFVEGAYDLYDERSFRALIGPMTRADATYELTHTFGLADFPTVLIRVRDDGSLINHSANPTVATNIATPMRTAVEASSPSYLQDVARALREDRFALVATRALAAGEELTTNYLEDEFDPPFFLRIFDEYGIEEDYLP